jgi:hypothetical protein
MTVEQHKWNFDGRRVAVLQQSQKACERSEVKTVYMRRRTRDGVEKSKKI